MSGFLKICLAAAVVTASVGAPSLTFAQTQNKPAETKAPDTNDSSGGTSEFERTRQHMIEMNKESQRTGKM